MRSIYDAVPAPIAHYEMNDNLATDVILDIIGNHNGAVKDATGTATSAFHAVAGKRNLAQDFDGVDDYIEIADHADFTPVGTPFSISAWVYMHTTSNFIIASKGVVNTDGEWRFCTNFLHKVCFNLYDNGEGGGCCIGRDYSASLFAYQNQWVHFVGTYDGGAESAGVKIYLNGVQIDNVDSESGAFVAVENLTHAVWIGRYHTNYANGLIDNVMFFDKELTARQVMKLADFRGREPLYHARPNKIYHKNINNKNSIFGGVKEGCIH